jgi:hypothetical protein
MKHKGILVICVIGVAIIVYAFVMENARLSNEIDRLRQERIELLMND